MDKTDSIVYGFLILSFAFLISVILLKMIRQDYMNLPYIIKKHQSIVLVNGLFGMASIATMLYYGYIELGIWKVILAIIVTPLIAATILSYITNRYIGIFSILQPFIFALGFIIIKGELL